MKKFLYELGVRQERYVLFCDSQRASLDEKKLYELRYKWLGNVYESKELMLEKIHTGDNGSDMLTMPTPLLKFVVKR
jgi:hypothetical protein